MQTNWKREFQDTAMFYIASRRVLTNAFTNIAEIPGVELASRGFKSGKLGFQLTASKRGK
eukprot:9176679-Prorocentrum_lima.AAC.1